MHFGLFSINAYAAIEPRTAARLARAAEAAGFESLWGGEHVVLPDPQVPPSPMAPTDRILDPSIALTFAAAHTSACGSAPGIIILPQRNPLVLAKELASLDVLSAGRLIFGIGVGYLEPEFRALGAPFEDRGAVTDEYLAAMRAIWSEAEARVSGTLRVLRQRAGASPARTAPASPVRDRRPHRAGVSARGEQGHGWYGFGLDLDATDARWTASARPRPRPHVRPRSAPWRSASRPAAASASISRPASSTPRSGSTGSS